MTGTTPRTGPVPELVIISGMSGAGRTTAANALEDEGWFVVDNLPAALIPPMVELASRSQGAVPRLAVVVDVRSRSFFDALQNTLSAVADRGVDYRVVFLEASDDALVRRFESVRRPHPLQGDGRVIDGIARERDLLRDLRGQAHLVIDTSVLNVHELRSKVLAAFGDEDDRGLRVTVVSFGYKYGLPVDSDLVIDCRFLPNPHWVPELRPKTGLDPAVRRHVLDQPGAKDFLERYTELLQIITEGYRREGKRFVTIGVGCTGGKHRSVAIAEQLAHRLVEDGIEAQVIHRDMGRE